MILFFKVINYWLKGHMHKSRNTTVLKSCMRNWHFKPVFNDVGNQIKQTPLTLFM